MARAIVAALIGALLAFPASAQSPLRGQWHVTVDGNSSDPGVLMVDADSRATYTPKGEAGRLAKYRGYVASVDAENTQITLTDGTSVIRLLCIILSSDLLKCVAHGVRLSNTFLLTRVKEDVTKLWTHEKAASHAALIGAWRLIIDLPYAYSGIINIDGQRKATLVATWSEYGGRPGGAATAGGHVRADGTKIEIIFTARTPPDANFVDHISCAFRSKDALNCTADQGRVPVNTRQFGMARIP